MRRSAISRLPIAALGMGLLAALGAPEAVADERDPAALTANETIRGLAPDGEPEARSRRSIALSVEFATGSALLTQNAKGVLDVLGEALRDPALAGKRLRIAGHTDARGPATLNLALSKRRAMAVKRYLVRAHGIDSARLTAIGWGESRLEDPLDPRGGINRRVEISVLGASDQSIPAAARAEPAPLWDWIAPREIDAIAASLIARLDGPRPDRRGPTKLAIVPFRDSLPIDRDRAESVNDALLAALRKRLVPSLHTLVADPNEAELLIIGSLRLLDGELSLRYKAVGIDGVVRAVTDPARIRMVESLARPSRLATLDEAIAAAVIALRERANDMAVLVLGGLRFQDSGVQTGFGLYFERGLANALQQEFSDVISERSLTVRDARIPASAFEAMDGAALPADALAPEMQTAAPGTYLLTGEYWDFDDHVDVRVRLRDARGQQIAWDGRIRKGTIGPALRVRPAGDFGTWREHDGLGPIGLTLSSDRYANPVYRIGERMNLIVEADRDVWLYCFYKQADDRVFPILPNPYRPGALVAGREAQTIPGAHLPFDFVLREPAGVELIKCFAYDRDVAAALPASLHQETFGPLPSDLARDIPEVMRRVDGAARSEASLVVTVTR